MFGHHPHTHSRRVLTEGSEGLITSSRTALDRYASVFLSDPVWPADPETGSQDISDSVPAISDGRVSPWGNLFPLKWLCDFYLFLLLIYLYDFRDACQPVALISASADFSLHLQPLHSFVSLSWYEIRSLSLLFSFTNRWAALVFDWHVHIDPTFLFGAFWIIDATK